ncbi:class I SAM-dependent rRNA methyltransferase [Candidatus Zixiibacteriota bacterium]
MTRVILKAGKEKPILRGHPWVFSGAIAKVDGYGESGDLCDILSHDNCFLARGYINRHSQITCRVLAREEISIDANFFRRRIQQGLEYRRALLPPETDAFRLVNAEGDFLPGLTVDVYGRGLVCQFSTAGMERWKPDILSILDDLLQPAFITERSDLPTRKEEGLAPVKGLLSGELKGPAMIREHGHRFQVDVAEGQKTGFFLDQRDNRLLFGSLAKGKMVCDCFCYTGAFSVFAAAGGAKSVVAVDSSKEALELAWKNMAVNHFDSLITDLVCQDVFEYLRQAADSFELMVVDPPPFARKKADLEKASRGYKDVNLWALKKLAPGGLLFTFSCSRAVDTKLFGQIIFAAATDAHRDVQIIGRLNLPYDHPVSIFHPEGQYLKGLVLRVGE